MRLRERAKLAHSEQKFIFAHRFSTGCARFVDIFSTVSSAGRDHKLFVFDGKSEPRMARRDRQPFRQRKED